MGANLKGSFNKAKTYVVAGVKISPKGKSITPVGKRGKTPIGKR